MNHFVCVWIINFDFFINTSGYFAIKQVKMWMVVSIFIFSDFVFLCIWDALTCNLLMSCAPMAAYFLWNVVDLLYLVIHWSINCASRKTSFNKNWKAKFLLLFHAIAQQSFYPPIRQQHNEKHIIFCSNPTCWNLCTVISQKVT